MNHFVHGFPCSFMDILLNLMYQERRPLFLLVYVMRSRATSFHGFDRMEHLLQENWKHFLIRVLTHLTVTGICAKGVGAFPQLYPCENVEADAYTIFTNKSVAGAMRGYGIPQAMWAVECHTEDICAKLNMDPLEFRRKNLMPVGYKDAFSKNELYSDTFNQCLDKMELKLLITFVNTKNTRTRQEISAEVSVWQSSGTTQLYGRSHLRHLPAVWY